MDRDRDTEQQMLEQERDAAFAEMRSSQPSASSLPKHFAGFHVKVARHAAAKEQFERFLVDRMKNDPSWRPKRQAPATPARLRPSATCARMACGRSWHRARAATGRASTPMPCRTSSRCRGCASAVRFVGWSGFLRNIGWQNPATLAPVAEERGRGRHVVVCPFSLCATYQGKGSAGPG